MGSRGRRELASSENAGGFQPLEPLGEDVGADPRQVRPEIAEPFGPEHQFAHDEQGPPLPDEVEGVRRPASVLIPATGPCHKGGSYIF